MSNKKNKIRFINLTNRKILKSVLFLYQVWLMKLDCHQLYCLMRTKERKNTQLISYDATFFKSLKTYRLFKFLLKRIYFYLIKDSN